MLQGLVHKGLVLSMRQNVLRSDENKVDLFFFFTNYKGCSGLGEQL